ncbi:hypothetical protein TWF281_005046 [Arthrobotrys megalospora]
MPKEHVRTGIWELYGEPFHKRWIWTVEDTHAFWILGFYLLLLIAVQKRAWIILKYLVYLWKKPVRLATDDAQESPLLKLSQMEAVKVIFHRLRIMVPQWMDRILYQWRRLMTTIRHDWNANPTFKGLLKLVFKIPMDVCLSIFRSYTNIDQYDTHGEYVYDEVDDGPVSAWFGVVALINGVLFMAAGILLPLLLTSGTETPQVISKETSYCDIRLWPTQPSRHREIYSIANAKYEQCWDRKGGHFNDNPECSDRPRNLEIKNLPGYCPFKENICVSGTDTLQITGKNISIREMGINSRSSLTMSHRLECAPVDVSNFVYSIDSLQIRGNFSSHRKPQPPVLSVVDPKVYKEWEHREPIFEESWIRLRTYNGPNQWTNESSGQIIANADLEQLDDGSLVLLPGHNKSETISDTPEFPFHPSIGSQNATVFFVIYLAGRRTYFDLPIQDPVFAAHVRSRRFGGRGSYHPDFEATGIGCLEQYSYCLYIQGEWGCTPWDRRKIWQEVIYSYLVTHEIHPTRRNAKVRGSAERKAYLEALELSQSMRRISKLLGVRSYVWFNSALTYYMRDSVWMNRFASGTDFFNEYGDAKSKTIWRDEVISWYLKAFWYAKARIRGVVTTTNSADYYGSRSLSKEDAVLMSSPFKDLPWIHQFSWCSRILLEDGDFSNISVFGFAVPLVLMAIIYLASYIHILKGFIQRKIPTGGFLRAASSVNFVPRIRAYVDSWYRGRSDSMTTANTFHLTSLWGERRATRDSTNVSPVHPLEFFAQYSVNLEDESYYDDYDSPLPMSDASRSWFPI